MYDFKKISGKRLLAYGLVLAVVFMCASTYFAYASEGASNGEIEVSTIQSVNDEENFCFDNQNKQYYFFVSMNSGSTYDNPQVGDLRFDVSEDADYLWTDVSGNAIGGKTSINPDYYHVVYVEKYMKQDSELGWYEYDENQYEFEISELSKEFNTNNTWIKEETGETVSNNLVLTFNKVSKSDQGKYTFLVKMKDYSGKYQTIYAMRYKVIAKTPAVVFMQPASSHKLQLKKSFKFGAWAYTGDKIKTWKSSNTKVATVNSNGKVTAKKVGTAKITAASKLGGKNSFTVKVQKEDVQVTSLSKKYNITLWKGYNDNIKWYIKVLPVTYSEKLTYSSSNKAIATINSDGKIVPKKTGKCKITVKSKDHKVVIPVTVYK